jgi:hypothetical protein
VRRWQAHQVVSQHHRIHGSLGSPDILHRQAVCGKVVLECFDPVLAIGASPVGAPNYFAGQIQIADDGAKASFANRSGRGQRASVIYLLEPRAVRGIDVYPLANEAYPSYRLGSERLSITVFETANHLVLGPPSGRYYGGELGTP